MDIELLNKATEIGLWTALVVVAFQIFALTGWFVAIVCDFFRKDAPRVKEDPAPNWDRMTYWEQWRFSNHNRR